MGSGKNYIAKAQGTNPYENLAFESLIAGSLGPDDAALFLWQNEKTVVVGVNQNVWAECRCEQLLKDGGKTARRSSGGGAVYHDTGNLNFTFAMSPARFDLEKQQGVVCSALSSLGANARPSGRNDITVGGRKVSGCAFKHTRGCSLQHGTLMVDVDLDALEGYLSPPAEKMQAKGVASVRSRVANLKDIASGITVDALADALESGFKEAFGETVPLTLSDLDAAEYARLVDMYSSWDWIYGESPRFDVQLVHRFDWGGVELRLQVDDGVIQHARLYTDSMDDSLSGVVEKALTGCRYGLRMAETLFLLHSNSEQVESLAVFLNKSLG